jgi:Collagen triple helix repeat (20 copies)
VLVVAAAVLAAGATVTLGQGSTASKPLRACVDKKTGKMYAVKGDAGCGPKRRAVTWNIRGKTGPPGEAGPAGAQGAQGAAGAPGDRGARGTFNFDDFDGMACDSGSGPDTVTVTYDSNGFASFEC